MLGCQNSYFRKHSSFPSNCKSRLTQGIQTYWISSLSMSKSKRMKNGKNRTSSLPNTLTCSMPKHLDYKLLFHQTSKEKEISRRYSTTPSRFSMVTSISGKVYPEHLSSGLNTTMTMMTRRSKPICDKS